MSDRDARVEALLQALRTIESGSLPDGDGVNVPTALFAERVIAEDDALAAADAVQGDEDLTAEDAVCACLDETGGRQVELLERCLRCGALMRHDQPADDRRMVDAVIEALDDVASKVLPGSDPMACVRAAAGVIERKFGGSAPPDEEESRG